MIEFNPLKMQIDPLFRNAPPPDARLWRYLSLAKFVALLNAPNLHFTRVDQFDDHFEGAWPERDLKYWSSVPGGRFIGPIAEDTRSNAAASCWLESEHESAAMWRLYANGAEGIAIRTTFGKLKALLEAQLPGRFIGGVARVSYIDHFNKGIIEQLGPNTFAPLMLKNVSYEHEREVRALIFGGLVSRLDPTGVDLPLDLNSFIDEIVINPFCAPWFFDALAGLIGRYGLTTKLTRSLLTPSEYYKGRIRPTWAAPAVPTVSVSPTDRTR
jgi:hypothetical protein